MIADQYVCFFAFGFGLVVEALAIKVTAVAATAIIGGNAIKVVIVDREVYIFGVAGFGFF